MSATAEATSYVQVHCNCPHCGENNEVVDNVSRLLDSNLECFTDIEVHCNWCYELFTVTAVRREYPL
jgi:hypothetical protein